MSDSAPEAGGRDGDGLPAELPPGDLAAMLRDRVSLTVLDVRDREEFEAWHVDGPSVEAVQVPHQRFIAARVQGTTADLVGDYAEPIVVVCGEGEASADVVDQLRAEGVEAANLAGGMAAWADCYEAVELPCSVATVIQYRRPSSGCLTYLVAGDDEAVVIDPLRAFVDRYLEDCESLGVDVVAAVDTHVHADHVSGARALAERAGAAWVLPDAATERGLVGEPDRLLADGDVCSAGSVDLTAVHAPGHTSEMTAFRLADEDHGDLLFGGDLLFLDSVARPDLEPDDEGLDAMAGTLHDTLATTIAGLPDETRLLPGHVTESTEPRDVPDGQAYLATLGALRGRLEHIGLERDQFVERVTSSTPEVPANHEEIISINLGGHDVEDETALELELGPNNCAAIE